MYSSEHKDTKLYSYHTFFYIIDKVPCNRNKEPVLSLGRAASGRFYGAGGECLGSRVSGTDAVRCLGSIL